VRSEPGEERTDWSYSLGKARWEMGVLEKREISGQISPAERPGMEMMKMGGSLWKAILNI
jgi:hypothetical protein